MEWPIDITKVKLKKNQTLKIQYKVLSGITWNDGAKPKTVIMDNNIGNSWEDACYQLEHAASFDTTVGATQVVTVTNTTGATVTYDGSSCICIGIQNKGLATVAVTEDGQHLPRTTDSCLGRLPDTDGLWHAEFHVLFRFLHP